MDSDWLPNAETDWKHPGLELGKMAVWDFRTEISAIQLLSNVCTFEDIFTTKHQKPAQPGTTCLPVGLVIWDHFISFVRLKL